jgi:site-specific recombinase XerD
VKNSPSDSRDFVIPVEPSQTPSRPSRSRATVRESDLIAVPERDTPARPGLSVFVPLETIEEYLDDYLADAEYRPQSPKTIRGKADAVKKLIWFLKRSNTARCGATEIKRFLSHVKNGHTEPKGRWGTGDVRSYVPAGTRSVQLYFVYIKGYFAWLNDESLINRNPLENVKQPRSPKALIKPLTIEEIAALLGAIKTSHHRIRNEAIIYLLLDTGLRVSELCSIKVGKVDIARGTVTIIGKGNKERQVWFDRDTAQVLKKYLEKHPRPHGDAFFYSERPKYFGEGLTPDGVDRFLKRLAKAAGIEKSVSAHKLRHSFATEFIKLGGAPKALQMMLGHESMEMTYHYVSLAESDAEAQHRQHSPARLLRGEANRKKPTKSKMKPAEMQDLDEF